jgi:peptidoglycan hydrolase-like protein with peptidoglycan-binding domain
MSGTLSPWPVVQNGNQGHPIRTLQFLLRAHGHNLTVDGMFGPATEAAVKVFQTSNGMTADGITSAQTWSSLIIQVKKGWRRSPRRPRGVPIPCWRTRKRTQGGWNLRSENGQHGSRLPTRSFARHSICHCGRDCWSGHLAGIGQRHVVGIGNVGGAHGRT